MSTLSLAPALVALLSAIAYLALTARPPNALRSAIKTLAVAPLALLAALSGAPALLILALTLCTLGDLALSRPGDRAFLLGGLAFAAGHLSYVALFLGHPAAAPALLAQPERVAALIALAALGLGLAAILLPRAGGLRALVAVYIPVILTMTAAALSLPGDGRLTLVLPAALAFLLSDTILAAEVFLMSPDHPGRRWAPYAIWPLYWAAQAGFLAAFLPG
ncbi:lysoplasmalogenase family protein [Pseudodonghicola flavimaris]|uniref:Lysoplasmalogenase family protein n=1 Tax=Pseudodonghicola flavimaris TaxID=3050036 RepID=A0ABT7EUU4_9RHOB|nr:lysoplasmalogenase family protein [Pseudodonghicola flavimaris]MDK3016121.1 lysoplasmalogenase family protein [Pseudodonghicola flavimaris]